jgi:hypothetical protein
MAMPATVRAFGIEAADTHTLGTRLTPELEAALPGITTQIAAQVRQAIAQIGPF